MHTDYLKNIDFYFTKLFLNFSYYKYVYQFMGKQYKHFLEFLLQSSVIWRYSH